MQVALIGAGLIGASWAALMAFHGHDIAIFDPSPTAEDDTKNVIQSAWPDLEKLHETTRPIHWEKITFHTSLETACQNAEWVQENTPDRLEVKHQILSEIENFLGSDVPIASSTTALMPSAIQRNMQHPERFFVAHPLNPPHLIPLVELVAGALTDERKLKEARAFYEDLSKTLIVAKKERIGHIANRLNAALYREAVYLVSEGIASIKDVDLALSEGAGPRLAAMGPHLIYHLGGGERGYASYLDHLGPAQENRWADLGSPTLNTETKHRLIEEFHTAYPDQKPEVLRQKRDQLLLDFLKAKNKFKS